MKNQTNKNIITENPTTINQSVFKKFDLNDVKYIAKEIESRLNNVFENDLLLDSKFKAKYNKENKSYSIIATYPKTTNFPSHEVFNECVKSVLSVSKYGVGINVVSEFKNKITNTSIKDDIVFRANSVSSKTKNLDEKLIKEKEKVISNIIQTYVSKIVFFLLKVYYVKTDIDFVVKEFSRNTCNKK